MSITGCDFRDVAMRPEPPGSAGIRALHAPALPESAATRPSRYAAPRPAVATDIFSYFNSRSWYEERKSRQANNRSLLRFRFPSHMAHDQVQIPNGGIHRGVIVLYRHEFIAVFKHVQVINRL